MPVFELPDEPLFPRPDLAEESGLLAIGGDLSEQRLLVAYSMGIFPWFSQGDPILWWSPDPRLVIFPGDLRVTRSLRQTMRKTSFTVTMDRAFRSVIEECAAVHTGNVGETWITESMIRAYIRLHQSGFAHSVECWSGDDLVGGLYGVSLGSAFFGESMFTRKSNASKIAFVSLTEQLIQWDFRLIDCQISTVHLKSLGAREISRAQFLGLLQEALKDGTRKGPWSFQKKGKSAKGR